MFAKYQAVQVEVDDGPGGGPNQLTRYTYEDPPAWHYDDSLLPGEQTWSDYRGHSVTWVETLTAGGATKTKTRHAVFRGEGRCGSSRRFRRHRGRSTQRDGGGDGRGRQGQLDSRRGTSFDGSGSTGRHDGAADGGPSRRCPAARSMANWPTRAGRFGQSVCHR